MNLFGITASLAFCLLISVSGEDVKSSRLSETAMLRLKAENLVKRVNSAQSQWKAEVNPRFAEMDLATKRMIMGVKRHTTDIKKSDTKVEKNVGGRTRTPRPRGSTTTTTTTTTQAPDVLPKNLDAREEWPHCADVISQIQDQAYCGSCWAVAAASTMSDRLCIHSDGKDKTPLSAADIMSCETVSQGCHGGYPDYAWKWYHDYGVVSGTNYTLHGLCKPYPCPPHVKKECENPKCKPQCQASYSVKYAYDKKHAQSYTNWMHSPAEHIMQEIYDNGPVEADFIVFDDFMHYKSGVYQHSDDAEELGGHAVRMIGWGEEPQDNGETVPYWLVANSWNYDWGMNGTFKILRGQDECYIESWGINFGEPDLDH